MSAVRRVVPIGLVLAVLLGGCGGTARDVTKRPAPLVERRMVVDLAEAQQIFGPGAELRAFGPFDRATVRRDYGRCEDGLHGALRWLSPAVAATGNAVVSGVHAPGAIAELDVVVAQVPGVDPAQAVAASMRGCGAVAAGRATVQLPDGSTPALWRFEVGGAGDRLEAALLTERVGANVIAVLVAHNRGAPAVEEAAIVNVALVNARRLVG